MVISNNPPAYRESQKHSMCNESIRVSPVIHAHERSRMFQMQVFQVIHSSTKPFSSSWIPYFKHRHTEKISCIQIYPYLTLMIFSAQAVKKSVILSECTINCDPS